jgi:hypothetical protein
VVALATQAQLEEILAEHGFRETLSPQEIERQTKRSWKQWLRLGNKVTHAFAASSVGV